MGYQIVGKQEINGVGERLGEKIKKRTKRNPKKFGKIGTKLHRLFDVQH